MFFNRLKSDFVLVRSLQTFHHAMIDYELKCQNVLFSKIDITMTTINKKL